MKYDSQIYDEKVCTLGYQDRDDLFPRCQHPDTRSDHEALRDIETKLKIRSMRRKGVNNGSFKAKPLMCLNTGQIFPALRVASLITGVSPSNLSLQINGKIEEANGLKFKWV